VVVVKRSSGISPFLIGLAVGAGLALLFAPASGADTRRRLARGARRIRSAATDAAGDVVERATDTFDAARQRVSETLDTARDTIATKRGQVERAVSEGRAAAHEARHDIEKRLAETKAAYQAGARVARESKTRDT
jgi:gas vesicle protein